MQKLLKSCCLPFCFLLLPALVFAQGVTTAALNGTVVDNKGQPLVGANVVAEHVPSGSIFGAASRSDGRFNIPGLRVGGPYTVTAAYIGYKTQKQENVYLALGQDLKIAFVLPEEAIELGEVVAVAERDAILSASRSGTITNVSTAAIERLPTITRTIQDFTRLSPLVVTPTTENSDNIGGMAVAGKNNRSNNFQVDGAVLDDAFGLAESGTPGGQANLQPISLDAIQEFQVSIAPYDVRQGNFAGGLINAITRSGNNQFSGSAYFFGRNESFVGDVEVLDPTSGQKRKQEFPEFKDYQGGFRFSGPLIQNKLFFFVNGEVRRRDEPFDIGINDPSKPINFPIAADSLQKIVNIARAQYGYDDVGGFDPFTAETNDEKIFARLDYNLSNRHRLTLRHNFVDGDLDRGVIRSSSLFTLESNQYDFVSQTNSTVLQLNSTLGSSMANEARVSYTRIRDKRKPLASPFPQVLIDLGPADVRLGVERFSQANALDQDVIELTNNLMYFRGNHAFTLGTHNEFISFDNLFIRDFYGNYEFDGIQNFINRRPRAYSVSVSQDPNNPQPRANWSYMQLGFYAGDEWKVTPKLNLNIGLRLDVPIFSDDPAFNSTFAAVFPGFSTSDVPSGKLLWSPRLGFNYDISGDRSTQIRGGAGIFAGAPPGVWLSNQYSNTGTEFKRFDVRGASTPNFVADPNAQPATGFTPIATTEINITDKDFKFPQVLRTNLAVDRQMPLGLVGTLEFLYSKDLNEILYKDLNLGLASQPGVPIGTTPDGRRASFRTSAGTNARVSPAFTNVIVLDNTNEGYQWNLTAQVQKQLNQGPLPNLFGSLSYAYMDAKDVNSGRSSQAISQWRFNEVESDPNNPPARTADFEIQHRVLASLSYKFNYGSGLGTTISAFFEGRSGRPFCYVYNGDANFDGQFSNDMIYVPASADEVIMTAGTFDLIETFIQSDEALRSHRGQILPRNAAREPWVNRLDLRVAQQIPSISGQNFEITLDILNFLNLLNSDWGEQRFALFQAPTVFNFAGYDAATGKPRMSLRTTDTNRDGKITRDDVLTLDNLASRWQIQLGLRYSF
jgi:hypothetical protein